MYNRNSGNRGGGGKVCDFFLQGRCKFGDQCKFEHPAAQSGGGNNNNNRFSALSGQAQGGARGRPNNAKDLPYHLNKEAIIADLKEERPIWPFSAYGPGRDAPRQLFGGFPIEQSPEELRVLYYLAQASGNPQSAVQGEQQLFQQMNEQVQKVLNDPDGAIQYLLDGDKEHPNRRDLTVTNPQDGASGKANPFSQQPATSAFGKPSAFGAASSASPFANNTNNSSPFGQSAQTNTSSPFGQPSQLGGGAPAFGQPSQPTGAATFGQSSQLGAGSPFAQAAQSGTTSAFGQASQLGASSAFGQPSSLGGPGAFGQASALGQSKPAFGQSTQPGNAFSSSQPTSAFGQASQMNQSSPFAAATQNAPATSSPFAAAAPNQSTPFGGSSAFGQANPSTSSPFGQANQASSSPFAQPAQQQGQNQANTSAVKSPFSPSHGHPPQATASAAGDTATPPLNSYVQQSNGYLQSWRGRPVTYVDNLPYFSKTGNVRDSSSLERIWFPGGPPGSNAYAADKEEMYQKAGPTIEEAYRSCAETGVFQGKVPLLAPIRAWTRYDV